VDEFGTLAPGGRVAHYEIIEKLGSGGMGVVYKALDTKLGRHVALKFLPLHLSSDATRKERFLREAMATAALDHVNVCTVHSIEQTPDGQIFIVMAYYGGLPLSEILRKRRLAVEEAVSIARQIGRGLAAAHRVGIVHRDVKPSNVMVSPDGLVKIVDFGLAQFSGEERLTGTGATMGTAAYMSPEQAMGRDVDQRTDVWSLGVVLCEMLSGQLPFRGEKVHTLLYKVVHEPPEIPEFDIPAFLQTVLKKALSKDLGSRYASVNDLIAELPGSGTADGVVLPTQTLASVTTVQASPLSFSKTPPPAGRRAVWWWGAAALVIALLGIPWLVPSWRASAIQWLRPTRGGTAVRHIVVLPFRNIGNDPANAALCDGLTEVLTSRLTGLEGSAPSLWVIPPGEVRRRKVSNEEEARKEFDATLAISGSVQKSSSGVELALNLVDVRTLRLLGSRVLRSPAGDLAAVEEDAVKSIADLLAVNINPEEARQSRAASTATPAAYEAYLRAKGLLRRSDKPENVDAALGDLNHALEQDPRFALAYSGLAEAYWAKWVHTKDTHWLDATAENAKKALQLDNQLAPAYVELALAHEASRNPELAVDELQQALKLDPRNVEGMRGLARIWERLGRTAEAEKMFQKAISLHPEYWQGRHDYALFLSRQGRSKESEQEYRRVIELAPDNPSVYSNLGSLYVSMNRPAEARTMFEKSISISPSYFALANLATVLDNDGHAAEAARKYEEALKLNDKDYRVWAFLASEYEDLHDPRARPTLQHAADMAEAALSRENESPVILSQLSYYYTKLGRKPRALELARKADLLAPNDTQILLRTAHTFELQGLRVLALANVSAALKNGATLAAITKSSEMKNLAADPRFTEIVSQSKISARK
jgi:serine/threonine-protein kinase